MRAAPTLVSLLQATEDTVLHSIIFSRADQHEDKDDMAY